jgi:acid stress-induced BolA-like protein IbaG/YrbA
MQREQLNILAINPGSRYLGIAVFMGTELRDWAVRLVRREKIQSLISEYIDQYDIHAVALKKLHPSRTSPALRQLVSLVKRIAKKHGLTLREYSIDEVERALLAQKRQNKRLLMEEVVIRYPFLLSELQREERNKNPYLIRMFETVGIGSVCLSQLDIATQKVVKSVK